jgi:hypothetical protein
MDEKLIARYGYPKQARYFVKSLEDLIDVVETVYKHVSQHVDNLQHNEVLRCIECTAVPVPRTLSSHILCFSIPKSILESESRPINVSGKLPDLKPGPTAFPKIVHEPQRTIVSKDITSLYDIVVFERFFKSLMSQNSDGIKMFTTKRSAEIRTDALPGDKPGYSLSVSFPGTLFKNPALPTI